MSARSERNPQLAGIHCPVCERQLDAATDVSGTDVQPSAGHVSMCAYCRSFLKFVQADGTALAAELLTSDEIGELPSEVRAGLVRVRKALQEKPPVNGISAMTLEILDLEQRIHRLLAHKGPQIQGGVLATLVATWLGGHLDADAREELLLLHTETVRQLMAIKARHEGK